MFGLHASSTGWLMASLTVTFVIYKYMSDDNSKGGVKRV